MLKNSDDALAAGWLYVSLEQLDQIANALQGARTVAENADKANSRASEFEREWARVSLDVAALDKQAREREWGNTRAAVRALSETAQAKTVPLLESARGFATALGPNEGFMYVGQARGEAEFARFCAALNLPRNAAPSPLRSILPELQGLQAKTNAAFQPPRSINLHPMFISLNSALKLSQELDSERLYAGALYQYLEAVRQYGLLDVAAPDAGQQSELKGAIAQARKHLETSRSDESIAQIFIERAESQLRHPDGSAPSPDDWKSAAVIVDQVLPAYFAAKKPPAAVERASGQTIDLTLVRWPYT